MYKKKEKKYNRAKYFFSVSVFAFFALKAHFKNALNIFNT